jgi:Domain of unknown function (DUF927)
MRRKKAHLTVINGSGEEEVDQAIDLRFPRGFKMTKRGLFYQDPEDNDGTSIFLCGSFEVIARNRDDSSNSWGVLIAWRDSDGCDHQWAIPHTLLIGDGLEAQRGLVDGGLDVGVGKKPRSFDVCLDAGSGECTGSRCE